MHLPAELIDKILSHLPSHDEESLRNCSLVAKSWLGPCQRRLFRFICITPDTRQLWLTNISPTNAELLRHVRELAYVINGGPGCWHPPCRIGDDLRDHLPSFSQLQRLNFGYVDIEPTIPDHTTLFLPFRHTLSSLSLLQVSVTLAGFVTLLGYFPSLTNLEICEVLFEADIRPSLYLPCPLRGRLLVRYSEKWDPEPFIDRFTGLKLEYEELVITGDHDQRLVAAVEDNLKYLQITQYYWNTTLDLSHCSELRQLQIVVLLPQEQEQAMISSITSTNLRKLLFASPMSGIAWNFFLRHPCWIPFDDMICELVDRLEKSGYKHTLEVEFQAQFLHMYEETDHRRFLPKFKKKGRVTIIIP